MRASRLRHWFPTLFLLVLTQGLFAQPQKAGPVGIMTATAAELKPFLKVFRESQREELGGRTFHLGMLEKTPAVLVEGGVGKVNASLTASLLVHRFRVRALFFSGVGGGLREDLNIGDVVVSSRVAQGDYVKIADGKARPKPIKRLDHDGRHRDRFVEAPSVLVRLAEKAAKGTDFSKAHFLQDRRPRTWVGTICTQDAFVTDESHQSYLRKQFDGYVSEMEGAAVGQVCRAFGTPWLVFRGISDHTSSSSSLLYPVMRGKAAANAALWVLETLEEMAGRGGAREIQPEAP